MIIVLSIIFIILTVLSFFAGTAYGVSRNITKEGCECECEEEEECGDDEDN